MDEKIKIMSMKDFDYRDKTVLLRIDINSPIDTKTKKVVNLNRINMIIPTIDYLLNQNAKVVIMAHQGDTLDYQNLISMEEHAQILSEKLNRKVKYIDDPAGPAAQEKIKKLKPGEAILLGNLRYLTEEVSTFENAVKLTPSQMLDTYLIRNIAPLADYYINDAFSAAHRSCPSMVAFQEMLPSAGGMLMMQEIEALNKLMKSPNRPNIFILGGLKISDAFGMMRQVLSNGTADKILTCGITGHIMLLAKGYSLGNKNEKFIKDRSLERFIVSAKDYLQNYGDKIVTPIDLAFEKNSKRQEVLIENLPIDEIAADIGQNTIKIYKEEIASAGTIFVNGPAGVYENKLFEIGTKEIWNAIADSNGYSVIGGGDTVSAASRFIELSKINYVCTAGGAMVRYLSGNKLPLIQAMENAYNRTY